MKFPTRFPEDPIVDGRLIVQGGMAPVWIVPTLDEVKDGMSGLGLSRERAAIEQLTFEGREEAFAQRIVVGVAIRAHRGPNARLLASQAERNRGVLTAVVGMVDDAG